MGSSMCGGLETTKDRAGSSSALGSSSQCRPWIARNGRRAAAWWSTTTRFPTEPWPMAGRTWWPMIGGYSASCITRRATSCGACRVTCRAGPRSSASGRWITTSCCAARRDGLAGSSRRDAHGAVGRDLDRHRIERAARARAVDADAVGRAKQGEVHAAQDLAVARGELIGAVVEREREVRADVEIGVHLLAEAHDEHAEAIVVGAEGELFALAVGDGVDGEQRRAGRGRMRMAAPCARVAGGHRATANRTAGSWRR